MRKKIGIAVVVLALALGGYGGWYWWTTLRFLESTDDAYVASDVSVISPKVEGYLKQVGVRDNQAVKKGAVLFVIDDNDFAAKVAQAQAAVVQAWYPGEQGGLAVAEVLFGDTNPAGRLPVTFYRSTADLPPFRSYSMANRTYRFFEGTPAFAFGHGLSYTHF